MTDLTKDLKVRVPSDAEMNRIMAEARRLRAEALHEAGQAIGRWFASLRSRLSRDAVKTRHA